MPSISYRSRLILFCLLSVLDFLLTFWLLQSSSGLVYEANPISAWVLVRLGWAGLAIFKVFAVLMAIGLLVLAAQFRPRTADVVLTFGCVALVGVVGYSGMLATRLTNPVTQPVIVDMTEANANRLELESELLTRRPYYQFLEGLYGDMVAGDVTLPDGARKWLNVQSEYIPDWLQRARELESSRDAEMCVATQLLDDLIQGKRLGPAETLSLTEQFQVRFGESPAVTLPPVMTGKRLP